MKNLSTKNVIKTAIIIAGAVGAVMLGNAVGKALTKPDELEVIEGVIVEEEPTEE